MLKGNSKFKSSKYGLNCLTNPQFAERSEYGYTCEELVNLVGGSSIKNEKDLNLDFNFGLYLNL